MTDEQGAQEPDDAKPAEEAVRLTGDAKPPGTGWRWATIIVSVLAFAAVVGLTIILTMAFGRRAVPSG